MLNKQYELYGKMFENMSKCMEEVNLSFKKYSQIQHNLMTEGLDSFKKMNHSDYTAKLSEIQKNFSKLNPFSEEYQKEFTKFVDQFNMAKGMSSFGDSTQNPFFKMQQDFLKKFTEASSNLVKKPETKAKETKSETTK